MAFRNNILFFIMVLVFSLSLEAQPYNRVVSLAPSLTKNIYYLKAQDQLVGCTSFCTEALNDGKETVATAVKVNLEKVISLKPDFVLVTLLTNPETIASIEKFNIRVEKFPSAKNFKEICLQFNTIGNLLGKEDQAQSVIASSQQLVDSVLQNFHVSSGQKMFFQIGAEPLFTVTPNNFMDDYINQLGFVNIASGLEHGTISREYVLAQNPDVIFITTMGIIGKEEKANWEKYGQMKACKKEQVFVIDSDMACSPTPVTYAETLKVMSRLLTKSKP